MEIKIEFNEGCINNSYTINGEELVNLTNPESDKYNTNLHLYNSICEYLISEIETQYSLPAFLLEKLYDGDYDLITDINTFIDMVKENKNTITEVDGPCEQCGDYTYTWILNIKELKNEQ